MTGNSKGVAEAIMAAWDFSQYRLIIDVGGLRSVHAQTVEKAGRKPLKEIKTMKDDAAAVEKESDSIKARYTKIFRV